MNAEERRARIIEELRGAQKPLSGGALAQSVGVSRQVIVQDVALLRANGFDIVATNRGYVVAEGGAPNRCTRLFKMQHTVAQTEDELEAIVDLGGTVDDVIVNHRVYGKISAPLAIKNRRDVARFVADMEAGRSSLLMTVTSGYHFHHISAESEEVLDEIGRVQAKKGYLAELLPHEKEAAWAHA